MVSKHGAPSRRRAVVIYATTIVGGLILLQAVLRLGRDVHAPHQKPALISGGATASTSDIVWRLLLASALIITVARLVGALFVKVNQPQVVGEIVAGLVLGPSVLGALWPSATSFVFPTSVLPYLDVLSQVGLVFFMFLIGLELDIGLIRGRGHAAATVSHVSIIVPFLLGSGLGLVLFPTLGSASGRFLPFALFLGASMSITAFPVLARILTERGIYKTPLGAMTLTCAAVDDVTAWCLLAVVVAIARAKGPSKALLTIGLSFAFIAVMILLVRPLLARLARYHEQRGEIPTGMLAALFIGLLASAVVTDRIGIHAIFGAFLFGAIMPQRSELIGELVGKLEDFTVVFFLPLFFAFTGLRTNVGLLGSDPKLWLSCGLVLLVAIAGKWGGSSLAAKALGMPWRESMAVGILMNTRGLTELIILNIGLDLKVIPPTLFAILVLMALVTTFMTTPLLSVFYPRHVLDHMVAEAADEPADAVEPYRIVVPIPKASTAMPLVNTALLLAPLDQPTRIILVRSVRPAASTFRAGPRQQESQLTKASQSLLPLVQMIEGAGHEAVPLVVPSASASEAVLGAVGSHRPDLVLLTYQRPLWGTRLLGGVVGDVLRGAEADVAVVVNPDSTGLTLKRGARVIVPHGGGFHEDVGLQLALRLARGTGATVTLFGPAGTDQEARDLAARAAQAFEQTGVWTVPESVDGEPGDALLEQTRGAGVVVLGVGDEWVRNKESLGGLREAVAARAAAPLLIVRRHGQPGRLRRRREWMVSAPGGPDGRLSERLTGS